MPLNSIADLGRTPAEELSAYLGWAQSLGPLYDLFVEEDDEATSFAVTWRRAVDRAPGIHGSEISGCQRPAVYSLMGFQRKPSLGPFWKRKFRLGHTIHAMLQDDFRRMAEKTRGLEFHPEIQVSPDLGELARRLDLHSHADGVFTFYDEPSGAPFLRVGVEIKSKSPSEFEKLKEPKLDDVEQALVYMAALDLPLMWILYYNKGTQRTTPCEPPYLFAFDAPRWAELEARIQARHEDAQARRLPERVEGVRCEFCDFVWACNPPYLKRGLRRAALSKPRRVRPRPAPVPLRLGPPAPATK